MGARVARRAAGRETVEEQVVTVAVDKDGIAHVAMCDHAERNAMSPAFVHRLLDVFSELGKRTDVKVVVLTGLEDVFSAGATKGVLQQLVSGDIEPADLLLPRALLDLPVPVIAAMAGHAIGGGFALGLSADLVVIARESRYGLSFMNMGFTPGMGTTRLLEHCLSPAVAHELLYTGKAIKGALLNGGAGFNAVLPRREVEARAFDLAARISEKPRRSLCVLKRVLSLPKRQAFETARTFESLMHEITFKASDIERLIEENYV